MYFSNIFICWQKSPRGKQGAAVRAGRLRPPLSEVFMQKQIRKISRVTYRSNLLEPFIFQQEEREKRHAAWVHLSFCSAQKGLSMWQRMFTMLSSGICQNKTRFWLLGRRTTGMGGQNFLSQAELCDAVCSGTLPFYLYELAAVFHRVGPSPRESISEGNLSKLWWKLSCYLPLLICLEYMGHMKNTATHKMARRNPSADNKTVQWFIFFHFTSLRVATYASQAAVKPFASKQGRGHLINHFYSHLGSRFGWKISFQPVN